MSAGIPKNAPLIFEAGLYPFNKALKKRSTLIVIPTKNLRKLFCTSNLSKYIRSSSHKIMILPSCFFEFFTRSSKSQSNMAIGTKLSPNSLSFPIISFIRRWQNGHEEYL